ncbi:unnamed protein product [Rhizoctonia solani]|uniref:Large ribosomal subunit protein mL44 n=1 Tax=Rhizoctonia solani TaxID=456999 RepID=A0A8H3DDQ3_9AGAM|nr:unnamed protein product [Rhizoctonia solani]
MKPSSIPLTARSITSRSLFTAPSKRFLHVSAGAHGTTAPKVVTKSPSLVPTRPFPPPEGLSSNAASTAFDAKLWASLQPPPTSALSALAARLRLAVDSDLSSAHAITLPLLAQTVTHPSFVALHQQHYPHETPPAHNGLLSALGNQLVGLFAMEWVVTTYPHLPTTVAKAVVTAYVGPTTSAMLAREWGALPLLRWMRTAETPTKKAVYHDNALASVTRAIVGLVYHSNGSSMEEARKFVHAHFLSRELDIRPLLKYSDPKLALINTVRKYQRDPPISRLLQESGRQSNSPTFIVGIFSGEDKLGEGFGSSLKMAEYRAAEDAMHRLYLTRQPLTDSMLPTTTFLSADSPAEDASGSQGKPEYPFRLLEISAAPSASDSRGSIYTPGILGDSEALYGSADRSGIKTPVKQPPDKNVDDKRFTKMAQPQSFIGARISLTSVADIRYKGILMGINHAESTIQLSDVVSMGTESRRPPAEFIPPSDTSYGTVVFRATEVKDLAIDPTPPTAGLFRDPAVLGAGPQPPGPYGGYPQPGYGQVPMGPHGPQNGPPRGMGPPPGPHGGYPQPPQQRYMNGPPPPQNAPPAQPGKPNEQSPQSVPATGAEAVQPQPTTQAQVQGQVSHASPSGTAPNDATNKEAAAATRPNASVRSASATLEKVERAMDELRLPAPNNTAQGGRGGRRGGRSGGAQHASGRVQVPDTEFDFEAMNAKFDKASLRPEGSDSDSESDSGDDTPNEGDKKEKAAKFYNPQKSFFDDISSDSNLKNDAGNIGRGRGRGRGALGRQRREEERNRNLSTFGEVGGGGYNNGFGYGGLPGYIKLVASKEAQAGVDGVVGEVGVAEEVPGAVKQHALRSQRWWDLGSLWPS